MVHPEHAGTNPSQPRMGRTTIFAIIAVVAGLIVLGSLTSPDPETVAAATSTTSTTSTTLEPLHPPVDIDNFSIGQIATGEPLQWEHVASFRNIYPESLTEYDGSFYLFGPASPTFAEREEGLRAWRSADGVAWEQLGVVIGRDALIRSVHSTPLELVAMEVAATELRLWRSVDGVTWDLHQTVFELENEYATALPAAAGSLGETLLIAADIFFDREYLIKEILEREGVEADLSAMPWSLVPSPDGAVVEVYGPLGLLASRINTSDLDLSARELDALTTAFAGAPSTQAWRVDESVWLPAENMDGVGWIQGFVNTTDGDVIAYGGGNVGPASWRSTDGLAWERTTSDSFVNFVTTWGDWLVAAHSASRPQIALSTDGETWENTDLDAHFPREFQWRAGPLGAGAGGIAAAIEGWAGTTMVDQRPEPIVLNAEDGEGNLTISFDDRTTFEFNDGEITHVTDLIYGGPVPEGMEVDLAEETLSFTDVDTGEVLGTFSFDALNRAQESYLAEFARAASEPHRAIAFSPDGEIWTIQDFGDVVGDDDWIVDLLVSEDRVVALVLRGPGFSLAPGGLFEVWAAPIP